MRTGFKAGYWFGYPVLLVGIAADFFYNVVLGDDPFCELPQECFSPAGCSGIFAIPILVKHGDVLQGRRVARWLCDNLLDPFDPSGNHCG